MRARFIAATAAYMLIPAAVCLAYMHTESQCNAKRATADSAYVGATGSLVSSNTQQGLAAAKKLQCGSPKAYWTNAQVQSYMAKLSDGDSYFGMGDVFNASAWSKSDDGDYQYTNIGQCAYDLGDWDSSYSGFTNAGDNYNAAAMYWTISTMDYGIAKDRYQDALNYYDSH